MEPKIVEATTFDASISIGSLDASKDTIKIMYGHDDWTLWLCLRRTIPCVDFFLDKAITIPPFIDAATFFSGKMTSMANLNFGDPHDWLLGGKVLKGNTITNFLFEATYNTKSGKGRVFFKKFEK